MLQSDRRNLYVKIHRLQAREKLPVYNTVDDAVDLIKKSHNIMILTGAGISRSMSAAELI